MIKEKKGVIIIQPYNTPYRNELFNEINRFKDIELHLVYVGERSPDRKWEDKLNSEFFEHQIKIKTTIIKDYTTAYSKLDYWNLICTINKIRPDVIITFFSQPLLDLLPLQIFLKFEFICWSESTIITTDGHKLTSLSDKLYSNIFKSYLVPGILAKEYLESAGFGINNNNTFISPNSVDEIYNCNIEQKVNSYLNEKKLKFLFAGSFVENKGLDLLLNAINILKDSTKNIEFHFVGDGPIKIPIQSNFYNHGFLSKTEIAKIYNDCHVLVLPSLKDCNPLVIIEAAKFGLILMVSDGVGNYPELIKGNGIVFKRGDLADLIKSFKYILSLSNEELMSMIITSYNTAKQISHKNTAQAFQRAIFYSEVPLNRGKLVLLFINLTLLRFISKVNRFFIRLT